MSDETWLREVLRRATTRQPVAGDRVRGAFAVVRRRRQQRVVAASCAAVTAVFLATTFTGSGGGSSGLQPVDPGPSPTETVTPSTDASPSASPSAFDGTPTAGSGGPSSGPATTAEPASASEAPVVVGSLPHPSGRMDVYVLLDATGSMPIQKLDPIVRSLYDRLVTDGVPLQWGLGTFRDTDVGDTNKVYQRVRDIAAGYQDFNDVLAAGGGGDLAEADTLALDGTLGIGHLPYTMDGQGATFRSGAHRVVVLITDAPMQEGNEHPTIASTIDRLRAANVTVVGVDVMTVLSQQDTYTDLASVAGGTGATAGQSVDCDGDGHRDIALGAPMVCRVDPEGKVDLAGLADALVRLIY